MALIAGRGALPLAVASALAQPPLVCALDHCPPDVLVPDRLFRLERLGGFLHWLRARGVTRICMCGAVTRPTLSARAFDLRTLLLLPQVLRALRRGDDGALRIAIAILERAGFEVIAAHEAVPDLLPAPGAPTMEQPGDAARREAHFGDEISREQAAADLGQACVLRGNSVLAREGVEGTDAMLRALRGAQRGVLYKAPKPGQERRADLPVIGPATVAAAAEAGLRGIIIEAGGVMVLGRADVLRRLDAEGMFLWVRERPS